MQASITAAPARLHPLTVAAAASVTLVSLVGAAAILGWLPASHGNAMQTAAVTAPLQQPVAAVPAALVSPVQAPIAAVPQQLSATRFQTADGRVFEEVNPVQARPAPKPAPKVATVVHHKTVVHHVQRPAYQPQYTQYAPQPSYASQHPVRTYVSDMNPVGTGVGAVLGGVLGHQVGGGNGKKLATVAGALLGGYAGNEISHDRNPLPFAGR
ncbi:MAG TPA: glycine zipper 2TM domain-containing protein [Telluria sp.]|nr:glycine zipper 2TM domain-containing protein [Telluria sp.]